MNESKLFIKHIYYRMEIYVLKICYFTVKFYKNDNILGKNVNHLIKRKIPIMHSNIYFMRIFI